MIPSAADRGQSVVIGSILIFGIVVLLLGIFQAVGVPAANEEVEFDHNQELQSDMQSLDAALSRAVSSNADSVTKLRIGTQLPNRFIFINPANPTGQLKTVNQSPVILNNTTADGEIGEYLDGANQSFGTNAIAYQPNYRVYEGAPETVIGVGATYNKFDGPNPSDDQYITLGGDLINGRTISFVTIDGNLSDNGLTTKIHANPISAPAQTVTVTNDTDANVTLFIPSELPAEKWEELLADEFTPEGHVVRINKTADGDAVKIVLEQNVAYNLRMGKVGVGTGAAPTTPEYVVRASSKSQTVSPGQQVELVVEVRDKFNNPLAGERVIFKAPENEGVFPLNDGNQTIVKTDSEGQARALFKPQSNTTTVTAGIDKDGDGTIDSPAKNKTTFNIQTPTKVFADPSGVGSLINPGEGLVLEEADIVREDQSVANPDDCNPSAGTQECIAEITLNNLDLTFPKTIVDVRSNFYSTNTISRSGANIPAEVRIEGNGSSTRVNVYNGDYQGVNITVPAGGSQEVRFTYYEGNGNNIYQVLEGDIFMISVQFADNTSAVYFVAPISDP